MLMFHCIYIYILHDAGVENSHESHRKPYNQVVVFVLYMNQISSQLAPAFFQTVSAVCWRITSTTRASWNTSRTSSRLCLVSDKNWEVQAVHVLGWKWPHFQFIFHHGCKTWRKTWQDGVHHVWTNQPSVCMDMMDHFEIAPKLGSWSVQHFSTLAVLLMVLMFVPPTAMNVGTALGVSFQHVKRNSAIQYEQIRRNSMVKRTRATQSVKKHGWTFMDLSMVQHGLTFPNPSYRLFTWKNMKTSSCLTSPQSLFRPRFIKLPGCGPCLGFSMKNISSPKKTPKRRRPTRRVAEDVDHQLMFRFLDLKELLWAKGRIWSNWWIHVQPKFEEPYQHALNMLAKDHNLRFRSDQKIQMIQIHNIAYGPGMSDLVRRCQTCYLATSKKYVVFLLSRFWPMFFLGKPFRPKYALPKWRVSDLKMFVGATSTENWLPSPIYEGKITEKGF